MCICLSSLYGLDFQLSYHKFNESQREQVVLRRLQGGEIVALISDAGMPGISDPGMELVSVDNMRNFSVWVGVQAASETENVNHGADVIIFI